MNKAQILKIGLKFFNRFISNKLGMRVPFHAQWEIIYRCNLKCDFCNVWRDSTYDKTALGREEALQMVDELADAGILFLNLTGGEPLMLSHTTEILRRAKKKGMHTSMNTNGLYVKDRVKELKNVIDLMHVSLDSPVAKVHEELRGLQGSFDRIVEAMKTAKEEGINVSINMTVAKENCGQMEDMCKFANDLNVPVYFRPVKIIPTEFNDASNASNLQYAHTEYVEAMRKLKKKYKAVKTSDAYLDFIENNGFSNYQCQIMKISLNIKPDGTIALPCGYFPAHKFKKNGSTVKERIYSQAFKDKSGIRWYDFCRNCTFSCYYVPTAMMDMQTYASLLKSYIR